MTADRKVFIHVGVPKTGTTFLQGILHANRETLKQQGIRYPGKGKAHFVAAQDLTEHLFLGIENPRVAGAWSKLMREVRKRPGDVVISHELLTMAKPAHIERAVADLQPAEIHVILTVRDFERQLPAVWQERLKNGGIVSFARHFEQAVRDSAAPADEPAGFWRQQDAGAILQRWADVLPPSRIHVITVPPKGASPELLWRRFAHVVGIEPSSCTFPESEANTSLSPAQARFLRRINKSLGKTLPRQVYVSVVKRQLSQRVAADGSARNAGLTSEQRGQAQAWSAALATSIETESYDVVGDLADLVAPPSTAAPTSYDDVSSSAEALIAVEVTAALVGMLSVSDQSAGPSPAPLGEPTPDSTSRTLADRLLRRG